MTVLIEKYRPGVDIKKLDLDEFCEEFVKAEWLEERFFEKLKIAVNHGFAGKDDGENENEIKEQV
ncbi:MAG: hypothetical protein JXB50_02240 [Spirochaetes bacterium]|nr:hypothetical protein [Spirochaetota bacterium]